MKKEFNLKLNTYELIVFSHWLNGFLDSDNFDKLDEAEKIALQNINCILEENNPDLFSSDYNQILDEAKQNLLK